MRFIPAAAALLFIAGPALAQGVRITEEAPGLLKQAKDAMTGAVVDVEHEADPLESKTAKPATKKP